MGVSSRKHRKVLHETEEWREEAGSQDHWLPRLAGRQERSQVAWPASLALLPAVLRNQVSGGSEPRFRPSGSEKGVQSPHTSPPTTRVNDSPCPMGCLRDSVLPNPQDAGRRCSDTTGRPPNDRVTVSGDHVSKATTRADVTHNTARDTRTRCPATPPRATPPGRRTGTLLAFRPLTVTGRPPGRFLRPASHSCPPRGAQTHTGPSRHPRASKASPRRSTAA